MRGLRRNIRGGRLGGGGAPGFLPTSLTGLKLWLRADKGITLNGSDVSAWADQSGTGDANKDVTQGTAAQQPLWTANNAGYNNKPTVDFTAANSDYLISGTWAATITQPYTLFVVGHLPAMTAATLFDGITAGGRAQLYSGDASGNVAWFAGAGLPGTPSVPAPEPSVIWVLANGASSSIGIKAKTAQHSGNGGTNVFTGTILGCQFNAGGGFLSGDIAEVIIYEGDIGATSRGTVLDYIAARYAITVAA